MMLEGSAGVSGFITALTTGLNASAFWDVLTSLAPFIIVIVPVALGFYFVRKLIKGSAKAKVRM